MAIFEKLRQTLKKSTNLVDEDRVRNRADINQQYTDSEFREKNYKKKKRNEISDSLDYRRKQLGGLGGP